MKKAGIDTWLRVGIVALMVVLAVGIYQGIYQRVVVAGDSAPEFSVKTEDGRTVALKDFGGKVLVLNFWASWCQPCVQETPSLSAFAAAYAPKKVVVLGISVDKDPKAYAAFLQRFQPAFLTARDAVVHGEYGTFMYPETYIIDTNGKVLRKYEEPIDWTAPSVTQYIDSLL